MKIETAFGPTPLEYRRRDCLLWLGVTALLIHLGITALSVDVPLARWVAEENTPQAVRDVLQRSEAFAHGIGITVILIIIFTVDVGRRWALPRVLLAVVGAGLSANVMKLVVSRTRPHGFDLAEPLIDGFKGWLPMFTVDNVDRSIPSAHTATVVAFAMALAWLYPRGRWLFAAIAILAGLQRIDSMSHFLSDVCWGAAVGWFISRGIISYWLTVPLFNRWEARRFASASLALPPAGAGRAASDKTAKAA